VKSEPHETWHGDRGPRARSCTLNRPTGALCAARNAACN